MVNAMRWVGLSACFSLPVCVAFIGNMNQTSLQANCCYYDFINFVGLCNNDLFNGEKREKSFRDISRL